jgi:hypothetical protein
MHRCRQCSAPNRHAQINAAPRSRSIAARGNQPDPTTMSHRFFRSPRSPPARSATSWKCRKRSTLQITSCAGHGSCVEQRVFATSTAKVTRSYKHGGLLCAACKQAWHTLPQVLRPSAQYSLGCIRTTHIGGHEHRSAFSQDATKGLIGPGRCDGAEAAVLLTVSLTGVVDFRTRGDEPRDFFEEISRCSSLASM